MFSHVTTSLREGKPITENASLYINILEIQIDFYWHKLFINNFICH